MLKCKLLQKNWIYLSQMKVVPVGMLSIWTTFSLACYFFDMSTSSILSQNGSFSFYFIQVFLLSTIPLQLLLLQ